MNLFGWLVKSRSCPARKFILFSGWLFQDNLIAFYIVRYRIIRIVESSPVFYRILNRRPYCGIAAITASSRLDRNLYGSLFQTGSRPASECIAFSDWRGQCDRIFCGIACRIFRCFCPTCKIVGDRISGCLPARIKGCMTGNRIVLHIKGYGCCLIFVPSGKGIVLSFRRIRNDRDWISHKSRCFRIERCIRSIIAVKAYGNHLRPARIELHTS